MPDLPTSIDIWSCPECGHRSLTIGGRGHLRECSRWPSGRGVVNRYVLAEPTDEMVERAARAIYEHQGDTTPWDDLDPSRESWERAAVNGHRAEARAALAAAFSTKEVAG